MSEQFDQSRRGLIKFAVGTCLTLLVSPKTYADDIINQLATGTINQIISVRIWPSSVYTRLTIEAEHEIAAKSSKLDNPARFVIDILNSHLNAVLKELSSTDFSGDPLISQIRVGQFTPNTVRIVLDLRQAVSVQTAEVEPISIGNLNYKSRYIFDIYPENNANEKSDEFDDQLLALLQLNAKKEANSTLSTSKATVVRDRNIPQITEIPDNPSRSKQAKLLVMIDPGHGGEDPGAIGPTGVKEKVVVLDIAKRLQEMLNATDTMYAQLTRKQDIFIPLATRVAIARRAKADVFISIHADAFTSPKARGSSVFVLSDRGASSAFARYIARTQNDADSIGGMSFKTRDKIVNHILLDMTQSSVLRKSNRLGNIVLNNLKQINRLHNNSVERAAFAVLKAPDIPSLLIESAFISHPEEEQLLKTAMFREKVAAQIFASLELYAKQNYQLG